jgi:hypothetical protein
MTGRWRVAVLVALAASCNPDDPPGDGVPPATDCPTDSWVRYDNFAEPLVSTWCLPCHSSTLPEALRQGAPVGMNFDSYDGIVQWSDRMLDRMSIRADMPPKAGPSPDERALFAEWIACGLPAPPEPGPPGVCAELTWIEGDAGTDVCANGNAVRGDLTIDAETDLAGLCAVDGDLRLTGTGARAAPALTAIGGDLVAEGTGVTAIDLPALTAVAGAVRVTGNAGLTTLSVPSLASAAEVAIADNALTALDVSGVADVVGDLRITDDDALTTVDFARLQTVGGTLEVSRLGALTTVWNPDTILTIGGDLRIEDDPVLGALGAFASVTSVGGSVVLRATDLPSLGGFLDLTTVGGDVEVADNPSLDHIVAFQALASVGGALDLHGNGQLTEMLGLAELETIGGNLLLAANPHLVVVNGYEVLTAIGGNLNVSAMDDLAAITGFDALTAVGGIVVEDNPSMQRLQTVEGVDTCGELTLRALPALLAFPDLDSLQSVVSLEVDAVGAPNLDGLGALRNVDTYVRVENNQDLTSILGMSGVVSIGGALTIRDNPLLPTDQATAVAADIVIGGPTDISGNAP